jgi:hypothetical protein
MSYIEQIAYYKNDRSEVPNQVLARGLAEQENKKGIKEIAGYLFDKNKSIASDCIKVMYEIGYVKPELIADYASTFIELLSGTQNRMVWGAMIALSTIAQREADKLFQNKEIILHTIKNGTVITQVSGIKALAGIASAKAAYKKELLPVLFDYLEACRPVDFATRTETILPVIELADEKEVLKNILQLKIPELSEAQLKKLNKVLNKNNFIVSSG